MSKIEKQVRYTYNGKVCTFIETLSPNDNHLFCTTIQGQCAYIMTNSNFIITNKSEICKENDMFVGQRLKQIIFYRDTNTDDFFVKSGSDIYVSDNRVVQVDEDMNIIKEWISDGK